MVLDLVPIGRDFIVDGLGDAAIVAAGPRFIFIFLAEGSLELIAFVKAQSRGLAEKGRVRVDVLIRQLAAGARGLESGLVLHLRVAVQGLNVVRVRLPLDFAQQVGPLPLEKRVAELDFIGRPLALVEVVHIELSDERIHVVVFEVGGQRLASKAVLVDHFEAKSV